MYRKPLVTLAAILLFALSAFAADVSLPRLTGTENSKLNVPVYAKGLTGIISFQFNILYDPEVLTPIGDLDSNFGCSAGSLLPSSMHVLCNVQPEGTLRVVASGAYEFGGSGPILNTKFYTSTGSTLLDFGSVYFFDEAGPVPISPHGGEVILTP